MMTELLAPLDEEPALGRSRRRLVTDNKRLVTRQGALKASGCRTRRWSSLDDCGARGARTACGITHLRATCRAQYANSEQHDHANRDPGRRNVQQIRGDREPDDENQETNQIRCE